MISEKTKGLPIGVFDSGLGGLTVVKEIRRRLPGEDIIYVGDTARVPYGTKSPATIRRYALQISFFLLQKRVKAVVVACNTVSAVALNALRSLPIPVYGVIEPGARAAIMGSSSLRVAVIGTPATVASHAYKTAIQRYAPKARVWETACPLFVPLVEQGWTRHPVTRQVAREYLRPVLKNNVDALVLGCTHYPLLKDTIGSVAGRGVRLIDSAEETAKDVETGLRRQGALNDPKRRGRAQFFVTDNPASFSRLGGRFLGFRVPSARRLALENL
jgi:glutamate racemase